MRNTLLSVINKVKAKAFEDGNKPLNKKKRIREMRDNGKEYVDWGDGNKSTHLMMDKGKEIYPSVFPTVKGSHDPKDWLDIPDSNKAYNEAKNRGEVVKFNSERRALKMALGAWKEKEDNPFQGEGRKESRKHFKEELKKRSRKM